MRLIEALNSLFPAGQGILKWAATCGLITTSLNTADENTTDSTVAVPRGSDSCNANAQQMTRYLCCFVWTSSVAGILTATTAAFHSTSVISLMTRESAIFISIFALLILMIVTSIFLFL